eukprot:TRINITY_DN1706_c0_g1_i2.p1 TRINITY_DN1706_c0_g1~~TRINITY_DN1706_c0_g1_i2.p1  ORF type:complete len:138 (-),score=26.85 TRINITY_DN1706_c0_g1_i2:90-503(-)
MQLVQWFGGYASPTGSNHSSRTIQTVSVFYEVSKVSRTGEHRALLSRESCKRVAFLPCCVGAPGQTNGGECPAHGDPGDMGGLVWWLGDIEDTMAVIVRIPVLCVDTCLLYTSDAADEEDSVDLGGRRIIKKKKKIK